MKNLTAIILIATSAYLVSARAEKDLKNTASVAPSAPAHTVANPCPAAAEMNHQHLQGVWRASVEGEGPSGSALLRLGQHPELDQSVRGTLQRGKSTAQVVGDVHEGELTLEESADGQHISATWLGTVVEGRCAQEIRGTWLPTDSDISKLFVLQKQLSPK